METLIKINKESLTSIMTYTFNAPRQLVWDTYTNPNLIPRWYGPRDVTVVVDKMDFNVNGMWRYIHRDHNGSEYAFKGEYKEIVAPEKLVNTFEFEGMPGHVITESSIFTELEGKTTITTTSYYASLEDLEGMIQTGMEDGARETYERFSELLEELEKANQ